MSLTSDDLALIRQRRSYRAGIWVARTALPMGLLCLILIVTDPNVRFSGPLTFGSALVSVGLVVAEWVLFLRAGIPVFSSGQDVQDGVPLRRTLYRDVLGLAPGHAQPGAPDG